MRWKYEEVDFEPGGKDHASPGGSYDTSKVMAKKIFDYDAPYFQGYEFIGIRGTQNMAATGKMSGSTGLNLTPDTLLHIYQPEVILWLYLISALMTEYSDSILNSISSTQRTWKELQMNIQRRSWRTA